MCGNTKGQNCLKQLEEKDQGYRTCSTNINTNYKYTVIENKWKDKDMNEPE